MANENELLPGDEGPEALNISMLFYPTKLWTQYGHVTGGILGNMASKNEEVKRKPFAVYSSVSAFFLRFSAILSEPLFLIALIPLSILNTICSLANFVLCGLGVKDNGIDASDHLKDGVGNLMLTTPSYVIVALLSIVCNLIDFLGGGINTIRQLFNEENEYPPPAFGP